jgi:hypothetical protein
MAVKKEALREWHRLFGLLLTDFFTGSPFIVEVERDLSEQQQLLDVVIVRRGRGKFTGRLPDGLESLAEHNLVTFKSHQEALDGWAIKELVHHYVAYRKLVSASPSDLLPEERFRLYAVAARFPHNLASQVPWQEHQAGVYDCRWGLDTVRVLVAGQLRREEHNAPLHLFSASAELVGFGRGAYRGRSEYTSLLLRRLFGRLQAEGFSMSFTLEDFKREFLKEEFANLSPEQRQEVLQSMPPEERLAGLSTEALVAGLSEEQVRQLLEHLAPGRAAQPRKPRRKR